MSHLDLPAYFARLHLPQPTEQPSLALLNRILNAQVTHIPFENLDVLLGRGISLELEDIQAKLISTKRGGYCFELNTLLLVVLAALGFRARPLSARVRWQKPREVIPPRTHVFVAVDLHDSTWLADAGVGGFSLTSALKMELDTPQATTHDTRRIIHENERFYHQLQIEDQWHDVCEFTLEEMPPIDRELANWFTAAHPKSHFRDRLIAARATPTGRRALLNFDYTERPINGEATTRQLASESERLEVLAEKFGLHFPSDTRFPLTTP
jgi:N-hydroxyarylamine O-acetyltransferase